MFLIRQLRIRSLDIHVRVIGHATDKNVHPIIRSCWNRSENLTHLQQVLKSKPLIDRQPFFDTDATHLGKYAFDDCRVFSNGEILRHVDDQIDNPSADGSTKM